MSHTTILASLYPYIKGLPGRGSLTGLTALLIAGAALPTWPLLGVKTLYLAAFYYLAIPVNYVFSRTSRMLVNFRRLNGMTSVEMILQGAGNTLVLAFHYSGVWSLPAILILSSLTSLGSMLRGIVTRVLSGDDVKFSAGYSATISAIQLTPILMYCPEYMRVAAASGHLLGITVFLIYSSTLSRSMKVQGLKPLELLSAMLAVFLDGVGRHLERLSERLETRSDIKVDSLVFRDVDSGSVKIAIIVPGFHPGPFRNFGSTMLPYLIHERLSRRGVKSVILKGLSDHTRNIISRSDCEAIASEIERRILSHDSGFSRCMGEIKVVKDGPVTTSLIPLGESVLTLVTLHPEGMEDIPPGVMDGMGRGDLVVVDTHNCFLDTVKELNDRVDLVRRALANASKVHLDRNSELSVGYGEASIEGYGLEDGAGPLGIKVVTFKNSDQVSALVVIDGNNAVPAVREKILEEVRKMGLTHCEVATTDTHIVNGVRLGGRGYHPLGEVIPLVDILRPTLRAVEQALASLRRMEVSKVSLLFSGVKVMSDEFLREAASKAQTSIRLFTAAALMSMLSSALTTLLTLHWPV